MSLLIVGSIAYDTIETPMTRRENVLGGAAPFFAYAAGLECVGPNFGLLPLAGIIS
jgi:hypothetical protein